MTVPIKGGRPLTFNSVGELDEKIAEFKKYIKESDKPMTLERLACFLKCESDTIRNYEAKNEYFGTIKEIRAEIKADKLERLNAGKGSPAGIIFDLKNNHGMKDKTEQDINIKSNVSLSELSKQADDKLKEDKPNK